MGTLLHSCRQIATILFFKHSFTSIAVVNSVAMLAQVHIVPSTSSASHDAGLSACRDAAGWGDVHVGSSTHRTQHLICKSRRRSFCMSRRSGLGRRVCWLKYTSYPAPHLQVTTQVCLHVATQRAGETCMLAQVHIVLSTSSASHAAGLSACRDAGSWGDVHVRSSTRCTQYLQ